MRIQEAQKHADPTDPDLDTDTDAEHWFFHPFFISALAPFTHKSFHVEPVFSKIISKLSQCIKENHFWVDLKSKKHLFLK
jgi:hypothetical protein